jgi:hypothetical protein
MSRRSKVRKGLAIAALMGGLYAVRRKPTVKAKRIRLPLAKPFEVYARPVRI